MRINGIQLHVFVDASKNRAFHAILYTVVQRDPGSSQDLLGPTVTHIAVNMTDNASEALGKFLMIV